MPNSKGSYDIRFPTNLVIEDYDNIQGPTTTATYNFRT